MFKILTKLGLIYKMLKVAYPQIRPLLIAAIDNPKEDWDDKAMAITDGFLGFVEDK